MPGPEVLARCIAAIEQGATIEECLALYPANTKELEPYLRIVAQLRQNPPQQMSLAAFARGRAAVAAQARYQQRLQAPFLAAHTNHHPMALPLVEPARQVQMPASRPLIPQWLALVSLLRWRPLLVTLLLVMTLLTFGRNVGDSLPGSFLYPLKLSAEQVQGYLLAGAGQQAYWYARQVQRRLAELDQAARQGSADPELVAAVDRQLQQALDASAALPDAERQHFFATWLADLRAVQPVTDADATTVATLRRVLSRVEAAAATPLQPTVLVFNDEAADEDKATSTVTPPATTREATTSTAATGIVPASAVPTDPVELPSVTPTVLPLLPPPPTSTPTPAPTVAPSPTKPPPPPPSVQLANEDEEDENQEDEPRQTDQQPVGATLTPTGVSTPTWTPVTGTPAIAITVTGTVTETITRTATPTGTVLPPSPTLTATATLTTTATATLTATPTPTASPDALVTSTPTATAVDETDTPTPTVIEETPTESPSPTARLGRQTSTPEATLTPTATPTPIADTPTEEPPPEPTFTVSDAIELTEEPPLTTETPVSTSP